MLSLLNSSVFMSDLLKHLKAFIVMDTMSVSRLLIGKRIDVTSIK